MIKQLLGFVLAAEILTTGVQAMDKNYSYKIINQCKYNLDEKTGKYDSFISGVLLGMGVAYTDILRQSGIDNDFAGLTATEFSNKMCQFSLMNRDEENKKTGGKYDVTTFYNFLTGIGSYMTLPPKNDTDTTK